jgi:hypothetical protein
VLANCLQCLQPALTADEFGKLQQLLLDFMRGSLSVSAVRDQGRLVLGNAFDRLVQPEVVRSMHFVLQSYQTQRGLISSTTTSSAIHPTIGAASPACPEIEAAVDKLLELPQRALLQQLFVLAMTFRTIDKQSDGVRTSLFSRDESDVLDGFLAMAAAQQQAVALSADAQLRTVLDRYQKHLLPLETRKKQIQRLFKRFEQRTGRDPNDLVRQQYNAMHGRRA